MPGSSAGSPCAVGRADPIREPIQAACLDGAARVAFAATLIVLLIVVDAIVGHQPLMHPENVIRPVAAIILAWLAWTRSPFWHATLGVAAVVLFCLFTLVTYVNDGL